MSTQLGEKVETRPVTEYKEPGDDEKFSHYVNREKLNEAIVTQTPVTALCGKVWTPTRDPEKFPVCPLCKEIWEEKDDE